MRLGPLSPQNQRHRQCTEDDDRQLALARPLGLNRETDAAKPDQFDDRAETVHLGEHTLELPLLGMAHLLREKGSQHGYAIKPS
jgi:hypothetical protein